MTRRRRLLTLGHSYVVGLNRRLPEEMARLDPSWEVTVAAPRFFHGTRDLRPVALQPSESSIRVEPLSARLTRVVHLFVYGRRLRSLLREGWDLVHCWEEPFVASGAQVGWWTPRSVPLVYYTFQNLEKRYPPPFGQLERFAMGRAAGWICSGELVAETLQRRAIYREKPLGLIPLGVDTDLFRPDPDRRAAALQELGWAEDGPPVIGFLGRLVEEKGLDVLTEALDAQSAPWRALLIGAGPEEARWQRWAARHGDRVRVLTGVGHDDVPRFMNAMDCLCAPSQTRTHWKEQFGRMLIEAFASGVPVVGSDSGEVPRVIGDAGVVVGERDRDGWRDALEAILTDPVHRSRLGEQGLARAHARFAWPVVARAHLDFFESLL